MLLEKDLKSEKARELYRTYFWFMKTPKTAAEEKPAKNETTIQAMPLQKEKPAEAKTAPALKTDVFSEPKNEAAEIVLPEKKENVLEAANETKTKIELSDKLNQNELKMSKTYERGDDVFSELLSYYKANKLCKEDCVPVLEEDPNCLLATVAASSRLSLLIEGESRSGKSLIMNKLSKILTSVVPVNVCSNKAFFDMAEQINQSDFIYITEYQSAIEGNPAVKEVIKRITEKQDATNDSLGETKTISGRVTVLSTGADENKKTQKRDVEVSGRFIILKTRSDAEKIDNICKYQDGLADGTIKDIKFSEARYEKLKDHMRETLEDKTTSFENPFAKTFGENYLPKTKKSVYYRTLYHSMINAFTKFDRPNRISKEAGKLVTSIADIYLVYTLYHETYCNTLKRLSSQSFEAMENSLSEPEKEVKLKECEDENAKIDLIMKKEINWQELWSSAYEHMKKQNPERLDEWINLQTKDGKVRVYNPILKRDIFLCDSIPGGQNDAENRAA